MAGTCPREGEAPAEMEQGTSFRWLQERNSSPLWKVGAPAGWEHPVKHPPLQAPGRIQWPSGPVWVPIGAGKGAGKGEARGWYRSRNPCP